MFMDDAAINAAIKANIEAKLVAILKERVKQCK